MFPHEYASALKQQAEEAVAADDDERAVAAYAEEGKDALAELRILAENKASVRIPAPVNPQVAPYCTSSPPLEAGIFI